MKKHLKSFLITFASLLVAARLIDTINFEQAEKTALMASLAFMIVNLVVKPILNLLLLPVNLLTLGLFRWLVNVFAFYLVLLIIPGFKIEPYLFQGYENSGFVIPPIQFSFFWTLVLISFIISLTTALLYWALRNK
ncbi:MAG: phage holin family protein [Candidatus Pacebacteria bacterium]|nr:phage holin family protein [Candidatus Paceibacterota bacterium]